MVHFQNIEKYRKLIKSRVILNRLKITHNKNLKEKKGDINIL